MRKYCFSRWPSRMGCCRRRIAAVEVGTMCIATCVPSIGTSRRTVNTEPGRWADLLGGWPCRDCVRESRQLPRLQLACTACRDGVAVSLLQLWLLLRLLLSRPLRLLPAPGRASRRLAPAALLRRLRRACPPLSRVPQVSTQQMSEQQQAAQRQALDQHRPRHRCRRRWSRRQHRAHSSTLGRAAG